MIRVRPFSLILCSALFMGSFLAERAVGLTIEATSSAPTGPDILLALDSSADVGGELLSHGTGAEIGLGQTFRLERGATWRKLTVRFEALTDVSGELISLYLQRFFHDSVQPTEILRFDTGRLPDDLPVGESVYLTIDHADIDLEADVQYGFLLLFEGGEHLSDARAEVKHAGGDVDPTGSAFRFTTATFEPLPVDLVFALHGGRNPTTEIATLHSGRFEIHVAWTSPQGTSGTGYPSPLTDASCTFWFFTPDNVELLIKVLDGCAINHHYWAFVAGLTDVGVDLEVRDSWTGQIFSVSTHPAEVFLPVLETGAFDACDAVAPFD